MAIDSQVIGLMRRATLAQKEFNPLEEVSEDRSSSISSFSEDSEKQREAERIFRFQRKGTMHFSSSSPKKLTKAISMVESSIQSSVVNLPFEEKLLGFLEDALNEPYPSLVSSLNLAISILVFLGALITNSYLVYYQESQMSGIQLKEEMIGILIERASLTQSIFRATWFLLAIDSGLIEQWSHAGTIGELSQFRENQRELLGNYSSQFFLKNIDFFEKIKEFSEGFFSSL